MELIRPALDLAFARWLKILGLLPNLSKGRQKAEDCLAKLQRFRFKCLQKPRCRVAFSPKKKPPCTIFKWQHVNRKRSDME